MFPNLKSSIFTIFLLLLVGVLPRFIQKSIILSSMSRERPFLEFESWRVRYNPALDSREILSASFQAEERTYLLSKRRVENITSILNTELAPEENRVTARFLWPLSPKKNTPLALVGEGSFTYRGDTIIFSILMDSHRKVLYVGTEKRVVLMEGNYRNFKKVDQFLSQFSGLSLEELPISIASYPSYPEFWKGLKLAVFKLAFRLGGAYGAWEDDREKIRYVIHRLGQQEELSQLDRQFNLVDLFEKARPEQEFFSRLALYGKKATPLLIRCLASSKPWIRKGALRLLYQLRQPIQPVLEPLKKALVDGDREIRLFALRLVGLNAKKAPDFLPLVLQNLGYPSLRLAVERILVQMGPGILGELAKKLQNSSQDPWVNIRLQIVEILDKLGPPALPTLQRALKDPTIQVKRRALKAIGHLGSQSLPALPSLINLLLCPDEKLKKEMVQILRNLGQPARQALLKALKSENPHLRKEALWALGRVVYKKNLPEHREIVSALIQALKDSDQNVKRQAAWTLAKFPPEEMVPLLIHGLSDSDPGVREVIARLLGRMGPRAIGTLSALIRLLSDEVPRVKLAACWALSRMGTRAVPSLLAILKGRDILVKQSTVIALGKMNKKAIPLLIQRLETPSAQRIWVARALGEMGARAYPALKKNLLHSDFSVALSSAFALFLGGEKSQSRPVLIGGLKDQNEDVQNQTLLYIKALGPKGSFALPTLREILDQAKGRQKNKIQEVIQKVRK